MKINDYLCCGLLTFKDFIMIKQFLFTLVGLLLLSNSPMGATKLIEFRVIDNGYLMLHYRDGEVYYRDSGTVPSAYLGHSFSEGDDTPHVFGERLK